MVYSAVTQDPLLLNLDWENITAFSALIVLVVIIIRHFIAQSKQTMAYTRQVSDKQQERADMTLSAMQKLVKEATTVQQSTARAINEIAHVARNGHREILERLNRTQEDVREVRSEVEKLRNRIG